jgi:hypothetical protein
MTKNEETSLISLRKKLVSNSKAILYNQITLPLGSLKMEKIINWIEQIKSISEIDLNLFSEYNKLTSDYPIGNDRIRYNEKFLAELDMKLENINTRF